MTITVGKRGTIVIPKQVRDQWHLDEGTQLDIALVDNTIMLTPSIRTRTRLDENLDSMRAALVAKGATLESAMEILREMRASDG